MQQHARVSNLPPSSMASRGVLVLRRYRYRRRSPQTHRVDPSLARQPSADGVARRNLFVARCADSRCTSSRQPSSCFSPPLFCCAALAMMAGAALLSFRSHHRRDRLRDELLRDRRLDRRSAVLVFNTWFLFSLGRAYWFRLHGDAARKRDVDDPRRGYPARYRNHPSRHGSILRHEFPHASWPQPVLRHRVLDRLLHQRRRYRALVALEAARATPPSGAVF